MANFSISISSNTVPLGGEVLVGCTITKAGPWPVINYYISGQLVSQDFSRIDGAEGSTLIGRWSSPNNNNERSFSGSLRFTVGRNSSLVGRNFYVRFGGSSLQQEASETINIIGATVPENPNPTPDICSEIRPDINWSGNFIYFPKGNLVQYPAITWYTNGIISTSSNSNWKDREWNPLN